MNKYKQMEEKLVIDPLQQSFFIQMIPYNYNWGRSNAGFGDMWDILVFLKAFYLSWYIYSKMLICSTKKEFKKVFVEEQSDFFLFYFCSTFHSFRKQNHLRGQKR